MQRLDKALLVISFGTTHEETRAVTIDAIEAYLAKAFPDRTLYRAWTSRMILRILKKRADVASDRAAADCASTDMKCAEEMPFIPDTVEESLERMLRDGVKDVLIQPTHIIGGEENDRMMEVIAGFADRFDRIVVGRPLLSTSEDLANLAEILKAELLTAAPKPALFLMGHGSAQKPEANQVYHDMQNTFRKLGYGNIFVATVEGTPTFEEAAEQLCAQTAAVASTVDAARAETSDEMQAVAATSSVVIAGTETTDEMQAAAAAGPIDATVVLAPLMVVAGDHAKNDMAGDDGDSWKNRLEVMGFHVIPVLKGLGEYPMVREMFAEHARAAGAEPDDGNSQSDI